MVHIITDSTADTTQEIKKQLLTVPLTVRFGEDEYLDGVTINHRRFYEMLVESDVLPVTSQPSPEAFYNAYKEVTDSGNTAVVITLSSKLSGTYQSAVIAAEDFEGKIFVVDGNNAALGTGILAELALMLRDRGLAAPEIKEKLDEEKEKVCLVAMADTLEYLKKGGRISKTAAFAGTVLSIKPVIGVRDGEVVVLGKARGSRQGNNMLVSEIEKAGGVDFSKPVMLGYTGLSDALLNKYIEDSRALWENSGIALRSTVIGSAIGTHVGPGAVAVAFFKK